MNNKMISGGQAVAKTLQAHGVDTIFCVAGESYLPVLDALLDYPGIRVVTCRHESGAAFMAEAYAGLTSKTGVVMVTRGPGACNASIGLHTAKQSSTPVMMLVGLISRDDKGREAFQEFNLPQMFGSHSKWAVDIERPADIPSMIAKGFKIAHLGRKGPVVLGLPEDVLTAAVNDVAVKSGELAEISPRAGDLKKLRHLLAKAQKPLIIAGGGGWSDQSCAALRAFAEKNYIPVAASFRRQDIFDHVSESYIGDIGFGPNPALIERVKSADVIIVLGARVSDVLTQGYTLLQRNHKLVHVYPSAEVFGKPYRPDLKIVAHPWRVIEGLGDLEIGAPWKDWQREARQAYLQWSGIDQKGAAWWSGADMTQVFGLLRELLPRDAIVTTDAGNFSGWANRYLRYGRPGRQLAPLSGAMGYGVPAAVAASIAWPDRLTLGICGDGGFLMTGQELATAVHHGAKPIIMVCNNNMYGTIRMHQERDFPGRPSATSLTNPDFVKLAESYGAFGIRVSKAADFESAWKRAVQSGKPALIEIVMDPRQIATTSKPKS